MMTEPDLQDWLNYLSWASHDDERIRSTAVSKSHAKLDNALDSHSSEGDNFPTKLRSAGLRYKGDLKRATRVRNLIHEESYFPSKSVAIGTVRTFHHTWAQIVGADVKALEGVLVCQEQVDHSTADIRFRARRASELDPRTVVGTYDPGSPHVPVSEDEDIERLLRDKVSFLVIGRPGAGKSHALVHNIKIVYPDAWVLRPVPADLLGVHQSFLPSGLPILLLDDLNRYLQALDGSGLSILDIISDLREKSPNLIVAANIRNTENEFKWLASELRILDNWSVVELSNWSLEQARAFAGTQGEFTSFIGTPFSVKHKPARMEIIYRQSGGSEKCLVRSLLLLRSVGLWPASRRVILKLFSFPPFNRPEGDFNDAIEWAEGHDLLKENSDYVDAYDPYLDVIRDWKPNKMHFEALREVLVAECLASELLLLANNRMKAGDLTEAEHCVLRALELRPTYPSAHFKLALVYINMGRLDDGERELRTTIAACPHWITPWGHLKKLLKKQQRIIEYQDISLVYLKLNWARSRCHSEEYYRRMAMDILATTTSIDESLDMCREVFHDNIKDEKFHHLQAQILRCLGHVSEAEAEYTAALQINPRMAEAWYGLAFSLQKRNEQAGAADACLKALDLGLRRPGVFTTASRYLAQTKRYDDALKTLSEGIQQFPCEAGLYSEMGDIYGRMGQYAEMENWSRQAIGIDPFRVEAWNRLATALRKQNRDQEACETCMHVLELYPKSVNAHYGLALCYFNLGQWDNAEYELRRVVEIKPDFAEARFELGIIYLGKRGQSGARKSFSLALRKKPELIERALRIASKRFERGRYNQAKCILEVVIEVDPANSNARTLLRECVSQLDLRKGARKSRL